MPYHTRIRSQTDPVPSQRPQKQQDPVFPPPGLILHPEDDASKVLHAIAKALLAVNNRAMTIKDLADGALKYGLVCTGSSPINAASQQITTYIRLHQRRCELGESKPLLKSFTLNGTSEDDLLTGALYSRAGGTATRKGGAIDTAFRKGTLVWYLSPEIGAADPFQQAGVRLPGGKKRRRRVKSGVISSDSEEERRPKIKLKIKLGSLTVTRATSTTTGSSESNPITLVSPTSSPSSPYPLRLPPYPIQSHCRHLFNIPNSPYDLPEYASPPPDSEDDFDDFHTSMMAAMEDSDFELPPPSVKDESDSELEEGSSGRRSRSTSWTTVADPKTPRDVDKPLNQPAFKIEGDDDTDSASLSFPWDSTHSITSEMFVKPKERESDLADSWMTRHDVKDLVSFDEPFLLPAVPPFPLISKLEGPDDEIISGPGMHSRNRSFTVPITWRRNDSRILATDGDEDDLEILGPGRIPPEEFDKCLWTCRNVTAAITDSELLNPEHVAAQGAQNKVKDSSCRFVSVNGLHLYELDVFGHVLRKRVDNGSIHLTSLLRLLSDKSPSGEFMQLDGASLIEDGDLKGTWVPPAFARNLLKGRSIPHELDEFLEDSCHSTPNHDDDSSRDSFSPFDTLSPDLIRDSKSRATTESSPLLPAFEPNTKIGVDLISKSRVQFKLPLRQLPVTLDEDAIWQRESFSDWNVNLDLDPTLSFSRMPIMLKPSAHSEQISPNSNDSPLSPQEEEIFHSLVDLGMGKHSDQDYTVELEEGTLEADDEGDSPKQLRRSKRVAARSDIRAPVTGTRRSGRAK